MTAARVALVTCSQLSEPAPDERLLAPALEAAGMASEHPRWDDDSVDWGAYTAVVVRSTWDYTERSEEFEAWLSQLEKAKARVFNPLRVLRWNMNKRYLEDLEDEGVRIVPTGWIEAGGLVHLHHIMEFEGWTEAVVKPMVGAGARDTWSVTLEQAHERDLEFRALVSKQGMMVQELMPEVRKHGELSLCFLGGEFSHAVRKLPAEGDFRVQEHLGGRNQAEVVNDDLILQARRVLDKVEGNWLYARVDAVVRRGKLVLMELEMLEPSLFLDLHEGSPQTFVRALETCLARKP